jgi:uracil-DNA glycosylase family protein
MKDNRDLARLRLAARDCTACELYQAATQTVFGEGPARARLVLVGEQPGDQEDRQGRPFVGPAGALLDQALEAAGVDRAQVYVTNAVKHFYFEERGKARIHKKPQARHVRACRPWLDDELHAVAARMILCLGATAAQALLGAKFRLMASFGKVHTIASLPGLAVLATYHPAAVLRMPDRDARAAARERLFADVAQAATLAAEDATGASA